MSLFKFFKKCEMENRIIIKDIKNLSLFDKILLAHYWGVKHLFFNVSQILIKEAIEREKNFIKYQNRIKKIIEKKKNTAKIGNT